MNNKFLLAAGVSSVLLLAGCASDPSEEEMTEAMEQKAQLEQEIADLKESTMKANEMAMEAQEEAARANERLDQVTQSYTK